MLSGSDMSCCYDLAPSNINEISKPPNNGSADPEGHHSQGRTFTTMTMYHDDHVAPSRLYVTGATVMKVVTVSG